MENWVRVIRFNHLEHLLHEGTTEQVVDVFRVFHRALHYRWLNFFAPLKVPEDFKAKICLLPQGETGILLTPHMFSLLDWVEIAAASEIVCECLHDEQLASALVPAMLSAHERICLQPDPLGWATFHLLDNHFRLYGDARVKQLREELRVRYHSYHSS